MKKRAFSIGITIMIATLLLLLFAGTISAAGSCKLEIHKQDIDGKALSGATFVINPDPTSETYTGELTIVDNGMNDEDPSDGVLLITICYCHPSQEFTITETVAPQGYTPAPPQTFSLDDPSYNEEPLILTFINEPPVVGGEAFSITTSATSVPWIALSVILAGGLVLLIVKKHRPVSE